MEEEEEEDEDAISPPQEDTQWTRKTVRYASMCVSLFFLLG